MYPTTQVKAISFISVMSFIFLFCFIFNLSQAPQIFLNLSIASLGYTFLLLGLVKGKKTTKHYAYLVAGSLLVLISLFAAPQAWQSQLIFV